MRKMSLPHDTYNKMACSGQVNRHSPQLLSYHLSSLAARFARERRHFNECLHSAQHSSALILIKVKSS